MLVLGTLIGALMFYFGACDAFPAVGQTPWTMVALATVWCMTMVPMPASLDIRGWAEINPLNGATWSLHWEYVANILYAFVFRRLSRLALSFCVVVFAAMTFVLCFNIDVTGFLAARDYASFTVVGGWSLTPDQLQIGLTRLLYPFFCGLLLSRLGWRIRIRNGFWLCAFLIIVLLAMPWMGLGYARWINGLYECLCILIGFPLIVVMGAGSGFEDSHSSAVNKFLGEISYPLYLTHYPLVYAQMAWADAHKDLPASTHIFVAACVFALALAVAYASLHLYDLPVRAWLRKKMRRRKSDM